MPFSIKTVGGPEDGHVRICDDPSEFGLEWPFPDVLTIPGFAGKYVKKSESSLPIEAAKNPHVGLGAYYEWAE